MSEGYRRGILQELPLVKLPLHQLIMSLVHQPNRTLLVSKSQDYWENKGWEMVIVAVMTVESILRGCIRQCLRATEVSLSGTPPAGVCRVMLNACRQSCQRFKLVWVHDKTDNFLKLFLSVKNEIALPLLSDSTLIQLRNNARLYWCKGTRFALCMNCSCATNQ